MELEEAEWPEERKRTKIARHPDSDLIHQLVRKGKSADWISSWLATRYPVVDEFDSPHPEAVRHQRWQLAPATLKRYRTKWMPECAPGVDLVSSELEDVLGRTIPVADVGPEYELEVLDTVIRAAQGSLARTVKQDQEMEMLQQVTLEAQTALIAAVKARVDVAQSIGAKGYEKAPDVIHQSIDQTNKNLNVDVYGVVDKRTGQVMPQEPEKINTLRQLLEMGPEKVGEVLAAAERLAAVEGLAEEIVDG